MPLARAISPPSLLSSSATGAGAGPLASFRVRNYRLYVTSQMLTNTSGWSARVAQDWLVLTLSGSVAMVGLTVALQFAPMLLFGLFGGVIADRYPRRRLLMITQSIFGLFTLIIGLLVLAGTVETWHVLLAAFGGGLAIVVDNPARQAFVHEIAGPEHLRHAISINSAVFQLGALVGPALAGVLIHTVGEGWTFLINTAACGVAVALLLSMRAGEMHLAPVVARAKGQLRAGLAHVREKPEILWACVLVGFVAVSGVNLATVLAAYADDVLDTGAGGYGLLNSMLALGALAGALASTRRDRIRLRHLVGTVALLGSLELLAATLTTPGLFMVTLVAIGATCLTYLTASNTLVQTSVDPDMRGRVLSLYVLILLGAQAVSGLAIGWVCENLGAQAGLAACAVGPLVGSVILAIVLARRGDLHAVLRLRRRPGRGFVYLVPRGH